MRRGFLVLVLLVASAVPAFAHLPGTVFGEVEAEDPCLEPVSRAPVNPLAVGEGTMTVSPSSGIARARLTVTFTFTVGSAGLASGGGFRIEFWSTQKDKLDDFMWSVPQATDSRKDGYVTASTNGSAPLSVAVVPPREVDVTLASGTLGAGKKIGLQWTGQIGTIAFPLRFHVQSRRTGSDAWADLPENARPVFTMLPDTVENVRAVIPGDVGKGESFAMAAVAQDKWGNAAAGYRGRVSFSSTDPNAVLPASYTFTEADKGVHVFPGVRLRTTGFQKIAVSDDVAASRQIASNYAEVWTATPAVRRFFGDTHFHTGTGSGNRAFFGAGGDHKGQYTELGLAYAYVRDVARLDFASAAEHDSRQAFTPDVQSAVAAITDSWNTPGSFTTFHAYEWTRDLLQPQGGHRVVLYKDAPGAVLSSEDNRFDTQAELWSALATQGKPALTIPHVMQADDRSRVWDVVNDTYQRVGEIFSTQNKYDGTAQVYETGPDNPYSYQYAWKRGHHVGLVGSTDNHMQNPGANNYTAFTAHDGGLAAVFAPANTREGLWSGFQARRTYATTGTRILADFSVDGHSMGEEYVRPGSGDDPLLAGRIAGTGILSKVEVVRLQSGAYQTSTVRSGGTDETCTFALSDTTWNGTDAMYYVRVTQADGEMAWSSPVWLRAQASGDHVIDDFEYEDSPMNHGWSVARGTGTAVTEPGPSGRVLRTTTTDVPSTNYGIQKGVPNVALPKLSFAVRDNDVFAVTTVVQTTGGTTYTLIYYAQDGSPHAGSNPSQLWFPLGAAIHDDAWHTVVRDLGADLRSLVPGATYAFTKKVQVYGDLRLDNLKLGN